MRSKITGRCSLAFCASTGRTATMFLAATLNSLPGVVGLHEGHAPGEPPMARLPLINYHNLKAWHDPGYAERIVGDLRNCSMISKAVGDADLFIDIAFYNAPLVAPLAQLHPAAKLLAIFRRCEGFVRSATIVTGEDRQPAGWPDRSKTLTDREKFISLGRLKPKPGGEDYELWSSWSGIQRNIWLWTSVNEHLLQFLECAPNCYGFRYEDLDENPEGFWTEFLSQLGIFSKSNLHHCVERSSAKLNQRSSYHIGPADCWSKAELALYEERALPLEEKIYG